MNCKVSKTGPRLRRGTDRSLRGWTGSVSLLVSLSVLGLKPSGNPVRIASRLSKVYSSASGV